MPTNPYLIDDQSSKKLHDRFTSVNLDDEIGTVRDKFISPIFQHREEPDDKNSARRCEKNYFQKRLNVFFARGSTFRLTMAYKLQVQY